MDLIGVFSEPIQLFDASFRTSPQGWRSHDVSWTITNKERSITFVLLCSPICFSSLSAGLWGTSGSHSIDFEL